MHMPQFCLPLTQVLVPDWHNCFTCAPYGHGGHTYEACTDRRLREASETSEQYIDYRVVIVNELRRLGIDPPAALNEQSANEEEPELGLVSHQSFPRSSLSLLRDHNVFIGDTGVTAGVTHDKTECINEQENNVLSSGIEGEVSKCASQVDLPGIICDEHGNELQHVTLKKMRQNPKANFNLLSLTKLFMDGWTMNRDANAIVMRQGSAEIRFDIVIKTERGAIFSTYIKHRNATEL